MDNSQKTQIDKLMELKQLYEQGILTKEEMLAEKQKILGAVSNVSKSEPSQTMEQLSHIGAKEPADYSVENKDDSFFYKYKGYIIGGIVLLLIIAVTILVPKMITNSTVPVSDDDLIPKSNTLALKGSINDKIGFSMHLEYFGKEVEGIEHYDSQKSDVNVSIKGSKDEKGYMILHEYDGNIKAGTFEGTIMGERYSGTFVNSKGKTFPFSANIMTESALKEIEKKGKQFNTTQIVYKNNTTSANVELSVDYPIKGNDALLQSTRKYISGVIAAMFNINEYRGSLNDGSVVINFYGKTKFNNLDKEWKENAYEGASAYIETVEFINDFENEYCVSLCAHSYYFHGGVSNEFCDASTFRKLDGKRIKIFRSNNDKELHRLIITAVKNKLGEDYEYVNEEFESSPMASIIHFVKKGVQFDYQHYEIGPGSLRQVSIIIPYEKIKPYLTEEAKNVLNI